MAVSTSVQREPAPEPSASAEAVDADVFDRLYHDYGPRLQRTIRSFVGADHLVDDVVQETFIRYYQSGFQELAERDPWPWLLTVSRRVAIDMHRRRSVRREWVTEHERLERSTVEISQLLGDPESMVIPSGQAMHVAEALRHLDPRHRRILLGKHVHGFKYSEIADAEGISLEALKSALARARRSFKDSYLAVVRGKGFEAIFGPLLLPLTRRLRSWRDRVSNSSLVQGVTQAPVSMSAMVDSLAAVVVLGSVAVGGMAVAGASPSPPPPAVSGVSGVPASFVDDSWARTPEGPAPDGAAPVTGEVKADDAASGASTVSFDDSIGRGDTPSTPSGGPLGDPPPVPRDYHYSVESDDVIPVDDAPAGGGSTLGVDEGGAGAILSTSIDHDGDNERDDEGGVSVALPCPPPEERGRVTSVTCPILEDEEPAGSGGPTGAPGPPLS